MSRIRTNFITNRMANGAPTVSNGLVISGVTTCNSTANQTLLVNNTASNGQSSIAFQSAGATKFIVGSNKDGDSNRDFFIYAVPTTTHRFNIDASGKVGINSTSPIKELTVRGTILKTRTDSGLGLIYLSNDADNNGNIVINQNGGVTRIKLDSDGDTYFNGGSVGINTTTIAGSATSEGALQVRGNISIQEGLLTLDSNIHTSVSIGTGRNAMLIGPTTVAAGATIDIATGSTLVVV